MIIDNQELTEVGDMYMSMQAHTINSSQYFSPKKETKNSVLMNGVQVDVVKDVEGLLNPSERAVNEWVEYDINGIAGRYNIIASVASSTGGVIKVLVDGVQKEIITVRPTDSMQAWRSVSANIQLVNPGSHKLRLVFNQNIHLNWLSVTAAALTPPASPSKSNRNIAFNRPVFSSSKEGDGFAAELAVDEKMNTRWASEWKDPQWIYVDFGVPYNITNVILNWEAHGKAYDIQLSDDAKKWVNSYSTADGKGGTETIGLTATGRYLRLFIHNRATNYGNSLFELQAFGSKAISSSSGLANVNKALKKPAEASSSEDKVWNPALAFDGNSSTRWSSTFNDPQWIYVDLGTVQAIQRIKLRWEAHAERYQLQVSNDKSNWTNIYSTVSGGGEIDDISVVAIGRYVRLVGTSRATRYGYSLWDFEVY